MIRTDTQRHFRWAFESAIALILIGLGLNVLVMQTLGSFDAAAVILALFLGFWAFVAGNAVLTFASIWLVIKGRRTVAEPVSVNQATSVHAPIGLPRLCHH